MILAVIANIKVGGWTGIAESIEAAKLTVLRHPRLRIDFSFFLTVICTLIMVIISIRYPDHLTESKKSLVWKSVLEPLREKGWTGIGNYKRLSAVLSLVMVALYVIFTFFCLNCPHNKHVISLLL